MSDCILTEIDRPFFPLEVPEDHRIFRHRQAGRPVLTVQSSIDRYDAAEAFLHWFGVRAWRAIGVGVSGQLQQRLVDQKRLGRQRGPGERSPVPLPDWYDLTHLVSVHGIFLGVDPDRPVWQYLPPSGEPYLNMAEVLHLRQPA